MFIDHNKPSNKPKPNIYVNFTLYSRFTKGVELLACSFTELCGFLCDRLIFMVWGTLAVS